MDILLYVAANGINDHTAYKHELNCPKQSPLCTEDHATSYWLSS